MKKDVHKDPPQPMILTFFTIEGHRTWRMHASRNGSDDFDRYLKYATKHPVVTGKRVYELDRLTGQIKEI